MLACHTLDSVVRIYPLKRSCHVNRIILLTLLVESDSPLCVVNIRRCLILVSCSGQIFSGVRSDAHTVKSQWKLFFHISKITLDLIMASCVASLRQNLFGLDNTKQVVV